MLNWTTTVHELFFGTVRSGTVTYSTFKFYVKAIFVYIVFMMKIKSRKYIKIIDYHFKR